MFNLFLNYVDKGRKDFLIHNPFVMTNQQIPIVVVEVHAVPFAVTEHFAVGTLTFLCPTAVSIGFEFVVPDINEAIFVDITLVKVRSDTGTTFCCMPSLFLTLFYRSKSFTLETRSFIERNLEFHRVKLLEKCRLFLKAIGGCWERSAEEKMK